MSLYYDICGHESLNDIETISNQEKKDVLIATPCSIKFLLGSLYFCNQRPGIFIAPFLLIRGWRESNIGLVLFISGVIGVIIQTPAGELTDETKRKKLIVWVANLFAICGCLCLVYTAHFMIIVFAVTATVISDVFSFPALYSVTLGIVGPKGIVDQVPVNESFIHYGNAFFAIASGLLVAFTDDGMAIFWICIIMRCISCGLIALIQDQQVDFNRARGMESCSGGTSGVPMSYMELLSDYHVAVFLISVLLFHFSNAAMLPLLSQVLFIGNAERGFEFAALAIITAQISMVSSAILAGLLVPRFGTKPLLLLATSAIPIRGTIIVCLLEYMPNNALLLSTQILDGLAGGMFGVLVVLLAENLSRGSGRFALLVGLARTAEGIGAAFSNLVGESIAEHAGYATAFLFLSVAACVPIVVYAALMPSAVFAKDGHAIDELSVSQSGREAESALATSTAGCGADGGGDCDGGGRLWRDCIASSDPGLAGASDVANPLAPPLPLPGAAAVASSRRGRVQDVMVMQLAERGK